MRPEIATLRDRMEQSGDWFAFREEIAKLHSEATTEEEYTALLEAFELLVAVGKECLDSDTYEQILPVTNAEYRTFLIREATEGEHINPMLLERVTRREVEAGRMSPDDDFRRHAVDGATVLGDTADLDAHRCRKGDWLFVGGAITALVAYAMSYFALTPLWLIPVALAAGWLVNEIETRRIRQDIAARREAK